MLPGMNAFLVETLLFAVVTLATKSGMKCSSAVRGPKTRFPNKRVATWAARRLRGISGLRAGGAESRGSTAPGTFRGLSADPSALNEDSHFSTPPQMTYLPHALSQRPGKFPRSRPTNHHRHPEMGSPRFGARGKTTLAPKGTARCKMDF